MKALSQSSPVAQRPRRRAPVPSRDHRQVLGYCCGAVIVTIFLPLRFSVAGAVVLPFDLAAAALVGYLILKQPATLLHAVKDYKLFWWAFAVVYLGRGVSAGYYGGKMDFLKEAIQTLEYVLLGGALTLSLANAPGRSAFRRVLIGGCVTVGLLALAVQVVQFGAALESLKKLGNPKYTYGIVALLLAAPVLLGRIADRKLQALAVVPAGLLVVLSGERSAWLGLLVAIPGALLLSSRDVVRPLMTALALGLIMVGTVTVLSKTNSYVANQIERFVEPLSLIDTSRGELRYAEAESISNRARLFQIDNVRVIMDERPLLGIGTDRYQSWTYFRGGADFDYIDNIHGEIWLLLAENGAIIGALYLLLWLGLGVYGAWVISQVPPWLATDAKLAYVFLFYSLVSMFFIASGAFSRVMMLIPAALLFGCHADLRAFRAFQRRRAQGQGPARNEHAQSLPIAPRSFS